MKEGAGNECERKEESRKLICEEERKHELRKTGVGKEKRDENEELKNAETRH